MTFSLHPYVLSLTFFSVFLLYTPFYKFCYFYFKYVPSVLLIYGLFSDDVSSSDFIALNDRINEQRFKMIWNKVVRVDFKALSQHCCLEEVGKIMRNSFSVVCVLAEIQTAHFLNTSQKLIA